MDNNKRKFVDKFTMFAAKLGNENSFTFITRCIRNNDAIIHFGWACGIIE